MTRKNHQIAKSSARSEKVHIFVRFPALVLLAYVLLPVWFIGIIIGIPLWVLLKVGEAFAMDVIEAPEFHEVVMWPSTYYRELRHQKAMHIITKQRSKFGY